MKFRDVKNAISEFSTNFLSNAKFDFDGDGKKIGFIEKFGETEISDILSEINNQSIVLNNSEKLITFLELFKENKYENIYKFKKNNAIEYNFKNKNILFKGVPGTGKSYKIEKIIKNLMEPKDNKKTKYFYDENVLKINIHSASSNADLMQGIGISKSNDGQIEYKEKQGLIFEHIRKACYAPKQPFVLILEEIQENSLNDLIGDLIYLIEDKKRTKVSELSSKISVKDKESIDYQALIQKYIDIDESTSYVKIPYLIGDSTEFRKMILPDNLYIFCTSNYRDDKKVIEDNLLRRFDVIEIYPEYKDEENDNNLWFESKEVSDFLKDLNVSIMSIMSREGEIHPDRFQIGHSNWLNIKNDDSTLKKEFSTALLKVIIDFKDIKSVDISLVEDIFKNLKTTKQVKSNESVETDESDAVTEGGLDGTMESNDIEDNGTVEPNESSSEGIIGEVIKKVKKAKGYKEIIDILQENSYSDILNLGD